MGGFVCVTCMAVKTAAQTHWSVVYVRQVSRFLFPCPRVYQSFLAFPTLITSKVDGIEPKNSDAQSQGLNHGARNAEKESMQNIIARLAALNDIRNSHALSKISQNPENVKTFSRFPIFLKTKRSWKPQSG